MLHAELVEQEPGQLCARPGIAVGRLAVALDHPPDPEPGAENHGEQHDDHDDETHAVILACLCGDE